MAAPPRASGCRSAVPIPRAPPVPSGPKAPQRPYNKVQHQLFYYLCSIRGSVILILVPIHPRRPHPGPPAGQGPGYPYGRPQGAGGLLRVGGPGLTRSGSSRPSTGWPRHWVALPAPATGTAAAGTQAGGSEPGPTALPEPPARGIPPPSSAPRLPRVPPTSPGSSPPVSTTHGVPSLLRNTLLPKCPSIPLPDSLPDPSIPCSPHPEGPPPAPGSSPAPRHKHPTPTAWRVPGEALGRAGAATSRSRWPSSPLQLLELLAGVFQTPRHDTVLGRGAGQRH